MKKLHWHLEALGSDLTQTLSASEMFLLNTPHVSTMDINSNLGHLKGNTYTFCCISQRIQPAK